MQTLIVTRADDAGSSEAATRAIREGLEAGVLRNVGLMACGLAIEHAADIFRGVDACLGLHVCLNAEWDAVKWGPVLPAEQVPSLVEGRSFMQNPGALGRRGFSLDEAEAEVRAQLDRLLNLALDVRYMDEHMGVGRLPGLHERLSKIAQEHRLVYRELPGLPGWRGGSPQGLVEAASACSGGPYLVVTHPADDGPETREYRHDGLEPGQVAREREADRQLWLDPRLRRAADEGVFRPVRYDDI